MSEFNAKKSEIEGPNQSISLTALNSPTNQVNIEEGFDVIKPADKTETSIVPFRFDSSPFDLFYFDTPNWIMDRADLQAMVEGDYISSPMYRIG